MQMLVVLSLALLEVLMNQPPVVPPPLPPPVAPPRLSEAALEAVRVELEGRGVCGPSVRMARTEYSLGARTVVDAFATDTMAVPEHQRVREVWVRGDSKPERPLDLIISGEPMRRTQLREILDDKKHPVGLFEVAKLVAKTDGALASVGSAHDGDPQGFPKEIAERVRPPAVTGPPGQRRFSFDTLANLKTPHSRVTMEVDGDGGLDLRVEPLLPPMEPPPGLGATPPQGRLLSTRARPPTRAESDEAPALRPQLPPPDKPGSR